MVPRVQESRRPLLLLVGCLLTLSTHTHTHGSIHVGKFILFAAIIAVSFTIGYGVRNGNIEVREGHTKSLTVKL